MLAVAAAISMFDLRGRQIPSRLETVIATKVKHWLITWAVYREAPPPPFEAVENPPGEMLFMACCSTMLRKIAISAEGAPWGTAQAVAPRIAIRVTRWKVWAQAQILEL